MNIGAVGLDTKMAARLRDMVEPCGHVLRVWNPDMGSHPSKAADYLLDKYTFLASSDVLIIDLLDVESLSFLFAALRGMVVGAAPAHIILLSDEDIQPLLAKGEPNEREAVTDLLRSNRLIIVDPTEDWFTRLSALTAT